MGQHLHDWGFQLEIICGVDPIFWTKPGARLLDAIGWAIHHQDHVLFEIGPVSIFINFHYPQMTQFIDVFIGCVFLNSVELLPSGFFGIIPEVFETLWLETVAYL